MFRIERMVLVSMLVVSVMAEAGEQGGPLSGAIGQMEEVSGELDREETGPVVQEKIRGIIEELERLLKNNDPPPPPPPPRPPKPPEPPSPPGPPGPGPDKERDPNDGLRNSVEVDRQGPAVLSPFNGGDRSAWGKRVSIEPGRSTSKMDEAKVPAEYRRYVALYFAELARGARK